MSLLEREEVASQEAIRGAMRQLESNNPLVVRRSYRDLKSQKLDDSQQKELEAFEQENPDP